MAIAYLGLGTNIGNKRRNMITAAALLAERVGDILALSGFYETEPWGFESENFFLNAAVKLKTSFSPLELLRITQQDRKKNWGSSGKKAAESIMTVLSISISFCMRTRFCRYRSLPCRILLCMNGSL